MRPKDGETHRVARSASFQWREIHYAQVLEMINAVSVVQ